MKLSEKIQHYGLEFITVFLGVTLSLLAESWRQDRSDLAAQHDSLVQMYSDLRLEETDMQGNLRTAQRGLQGARFLIAGVKGHDPDSVSAALTDLGQCSFFVPYQSEYTALKSSGRLTVIEESSLRQQVVSFYEVDPFMQWLHERDCTLTGELMDSMLGKFEFAEWPARDTARSVRGAGGPGAGGTQASSPDSARRRRRDFQAPTRYPRIIYKPDEEAVLEDPALRDRLVRLATQRSYLITQLQNRINGVARFRPDRPERPDTVGGARLLRDSIRVRLGSDTSAIRQNRQPRGGRPRPLGGSRNP
jgi:hypothetical protein